MTASVVLVSLSFELAILLAQVVAVARPGMPPAASALVAALAFALAWLVTAVSDAMHAPAWSVSVGGAVILVSVITTTATIHRWAGSSDGGEGGPAHGDDPGGEGPPRFWPDVPGGGVDGGGFSWWPGFERRLELYVAEQSREQLVDVGCRRKARSHD